MASLKATPQLHLLSSFCTRQGRTTGGLFRNRGHGPGEGQWGFRGGRTWLGKSALAQERWPQARARLEGLEAAATFSGTSTRVPGVF